VPLAVRIDSEQWNKGGDPNHNNTSRSRDINNEEYLAYLMLRPFQIYPIATQHIEHCHRKDGLEEKTTTFIYNPST